MSLSGASRSQRTGVVEIGPDAYRHWRASRLGRITDRLEERLILELAGDVTGKRILDVGCGDGALLVALSRRGAVASGLDADPAMLAAAERRLGSSGVRAQLHRGEAAALPFAPASFDVVTAITVLCFIEDAVPSLCEMARVLRPGGRLVLGELGRWSPWAVERRPKGWLGSKTWAAANFRTLRQLTGLIDFAGLHVTASRGAIFYPPCSWCAVLLAPVDAWLGRRTKVGAAFIATAATKPPDR